MKEMIKLASFNHGIRYSEISTALQPLISVDMPTIVFGVAPIFNATNPAPPNTPTLLYSMTDFKDKFGWSDDFNNHTLCEASYTFFSLYNVRPLICINVLDPTTHKKAGTKTVTLSRNRVTFAAKIILSSLVVKSSDTTLTKNDYTAEYDGGNLTLTVKTPSKVTGNALQLSYDEIDASKVTKADIIAALDLIDEIYSRFQVVPGMVIAPKWSTDTEVAAVMASKVLDINQCFNCICLADIPTDTVKEYADCTAYKSDNNLVDKNLFLCWPKLSLGGKQYHLSTQAAALMNRIDASEGDNVPYISPSNHALKCDGACLADGTEIYLGKEKANYLNSVGITTALNFAGAWRLWGNYSAMHPVSADSKDTFLPLRRMIHWIGATLITSFFWRVDSPINRRLIQSIVNSVNIWLNGLTAREMILGGRVEFLEEENPTTDLLAGKLTFHCFIGFLVPAQDIQFLIEFDTSYFKTLFS